MDKLNIIYKFDQKHTSNNQEIIVTKEKSNALNCYSYDEDFESLLNIQLPPKVRKSKQLQTLNENIEIIKKINYGTLSYIVDGIPYITALDHFFYDNKIHFHCAPSGFKTNAINQIVSYLIIDDLGISNQNSTHYHRSVIVQGILKSVDDLQIKKAALATFLDKFDCGTIDQFNDQTIGRTSILYIDSYFLHGKKHLPKT